MKKPLKISVSIIIFILLAGCTQNENFPVLEESAEPMGDAFYVCQDQVSGERIYRSSRGGDDTHWLKFYDTNSNLLEETPEIGPGTPRQYEIKTKVKNCKRTTKEYFESKITK